MSSANSKNINAINDLQAKLKEQNNQLSKAKSERDTLEIAHASERTKNSNLEKERNSLKKKLEKLSYLQSVFSELRGIKISSQQITNINQYKAFLQEAVKRKGIELHRKQQGIWSGLANLIGHNKKDRETKLEKKGIIGDADKEDKFVNNFRNLLNKIERI
ncbi:hypothetical protein OVS_03905 [Mycoplasma ovis str. Michigan]|uniref:Uncharacterized protein n=1 Tax=Mycoplasma ovis str. Michigan TaxID=1415773 RepID=A0ABM5P233_9MOLU|nr:hypothetical protein [Mycoplasma ovis]AHC40512.1 hypothetical protein OVS_03905 [Mycoplasma ovis str. Michigan]